MKISTAMKRLGTKCNGCFRFFQSFISDISLRSLDQINLSFIHIIHPHQQLFHKRNQMEICEDFSYIEARGNDIVEQLEIQSLRNEVDAKECEILAKELARYLSRCRRSTNLSVETVKELESQLLKEQRANGKVAYKLKKLEDETKALYTENVNINAAILQLEQTLDIS
jgi:hypothetical protein